MHFEHVFSVTDSSDTNKKTCSKCIDNCTDCHNATTCNSCADNFAFQTGKGCVDKCDDGYTMDGKVCVKCSNSNCKTCLNSNKAVCTSCLDQKYFHNQSQNQNEKCLDSCPD